MDKHGTITAPNTIRFQRLLPGPIERVWAYLTEPEKRAKWLATGGMDLRVGGDAVLSWTFTELDTEPEEIPDQYKNAKTKRTTTAKQNVQVQSRWLGPQQSKALPSDDAHDPDQCKARLPNVNSVVRRHILSSIGIEWCPDGPCTRIDLRTAVVVHALVGEWVCVRWQVGRLDGQQVLAHLVPDIGICIDPVKHRTGTTIGHARRA